MDRNREHPLGLGLTDHIIVENLAYLPRGRNAVLAFDKRGLALLADYVHTQFNAFIADEHGRTGDELTHFMLALAAERAIERVLGVAFGLGHRFSPFRPLPPKRVVKRLTEQPNQTTLTKRSLWPCLVFPLPHWVRLGFDKQPPNCTQNQGHTAKFVAADRQSQKKLAPRLARGLCLRLFQLNRALGCHLVDNTEGLRLLGRHEMIPIQCSFNGFVGLACMIYVNLVESPLDLQNILRVPLDIGRLPLETA